jgi:sugar lactone lactonase YvrE
MSRGAPAVVCNVGAILGEGPHWSAAEQKLWFVDIKEQLLHRFDPQKRKLDTWPAPAQPGWVLTSDDGGLVAGLQSGLHRFDPKTGRFASLAAPERDLPGNRLNDATVDGAGRIWFGSMDDEEAAPRGRVYVHDRGRVTCSTIAPCTITNGPAFSPDGRTLYHVDTLAGEITAFDVTADGALGAARPFVRIAPADGYPDGPSVDSAGCLWIGLFGGWGVRRYSSAGELLEFVRFPVANVTKIAFGGRDLKTVYATTASKGLSAAERNAQPYAGDLFEFHVDVAGLPTPPIRMLH